VINRKPCSGHGFFSFLEANMDEIYRAYFRCPRCAKRFTYECNLTDYPARCPKCGRYPVKPYSHALVHSVNDELSD
jgi:PHP family Zn ribbon phosphoesterase